jgi:DNA-binding response OmpR family regulator
MVLAMVNQAYCFLYQAVVIRENLSAKRKVTTMSRQQKKHPEALPPPLPQFRLASDITIDFEAHEYEVHGKRVPMPPRESQLLSPLVEKNRTSPRGFVTTNFLVERMLPDSREYTDPEQSIAQTASNVRRKWGETPRNPRLLVNKRGIGYQLRPEPGYGYEVPEENEMGTSR